MRASLAIALLLLPVLTFGQYVEFGAGGGVAISGQPGGNMYYKGNQSAANPTALFSLLYNNTYEMQFGGQLRIMPLSALSTSPYSDANIGRFGGGSKKIVYADYLTDFTLIANKKVVVNQSELYAGVAVGAVHTNSTKKLNGDELYKYPDGGIGSAFGVQAGYNLVAGTNLVINFEAAARFYDISYGSIIYSKAAGASRIHGNIAVFPLAITLRYRFLGWNRSGVNPHTGRFDMDYYQRRHPIYPRYFSW